MAGNETVVDGSFAEDSPLWLPLENGGRTDLVGRTDDFSYILPSSRIWSPFLGEWVEVHGGTEQVVLPFTLSRGVSVTVSFWMQRFSDWQAVCDVFLDSGDGVFTNITSVTFLAVPVIGTWYFFETAPFTVDGLVGGIRFLTRAPLDATNGILLLDDVSVLRGVQDAQVSTPENGQFDGVLFEEWPIDEIAGTMKPKDEMVVNHGDGIGTYRIRNKCDQPDRDTLLKDWTSPRPREWEEI